MKRININREKERIKERKPVLLTFLFILLIVGVIAGLIVFVNLSINYFNEVDIVKEAVSEYESYRVEDQFKNISELHWNHMPLTYKIINEEDCEGVPRKMREALENIENSTEGIVSFIESDEEIVDLKLVCVDRGNRIEELKTCKNITFDYKKDKIAYFEEGILNISRDYFLSASSIKLEDDESIWQVCYIDMEEAGIYFYEGILGIANPEFHENLILNASIDFYKSEDGWISCYFPVKEIHELLHTFGFAHIFEFADGYRDVNDLRDIMSPGIYCPYQKKIDEKYIDCLRYIYSNSEIEGNCSKTKFLAYNYGSCDDWYEVEGTNECCPEPNMKILYGYCYENLNRNYAYEKPLNISQKIPIPKKW